MGSQKLKLTFKLYQHLEYNLCMSGKKVDMTEIIGWTEKFIEKYQEEFERMNGYTLEMRRHDELVKQIGEMHRNKHSNHSDAR